MHMREHADGITAGSVSGFGITQGSSTQYVGFLVPETMPMMGFVRSEIPKAQQ